MIFHIFEGKKFQGLDTIDLFSIGELYIYNDYFGRSGYVKYSVYIYKYLQSSESMALLIIKTCELGHVQTTCFNRRRSLRFKSGPLRPCGPVGDV